MSCPAPGQTPQTGATVVAVVGAGVVVVGIGVVVGASVVVVVATVVVVVTGTVVVINGVGAGVGAFVGQLACVQFLPI